MIEKQTKGDHYESLFIDRKRQIGKLKKETNAKELMGRKVTETIKKLEMPSSLNF